MISGEEWVLDKQEALLNHSAEREVEREETQTLIRSLSLSLLRERESKCEPVKERQDERAPEWKRGVLHWAEGQAIFQRSQHARGDLRQK